MVKNSGEHTLAWHPSALRIQCTQQRWPPCSRAAEHGLGRPGPGVHSARLRRRRADLAPSRRPAPAACGRSSAPFVDDSEADVLAHMDFPARHRTKVDSTNPLERLNKRGQEARRCRRHPPQRGRHHPPDRRRPTGGQRRMAGPIHANRGNGRIGNADHRRRLPPWLHDPGPSQLRRNFHHIESSLAPR
jgi:hypothetical protein